jgi:transcription elongation factor Elf1
MPLTTAQKAKYLKSPNHCPFCESEDISAWNWDGESSRQDVVCEHCGERWYDIYKLVDIERFEEEP